MMKLLRNKKNKGELITLYKGNFHPNQLQNLQNFHHLKPQEKRKKVTLPLTIYCS
jgi:hypothetical protein